MTLVRGEWWTQSKRPILKGLEDVEQGDFASCAITAADIADSAITSGKIAASAVTCTALADAHVVSAKLATASVTSIKVSDPAATRTHVGVTADPAAGAGLGSTSFTVWRAKERSEIRSITIVPLTAWSAVTSGAQLQVWTCVGAVASFDACSTSVGPVGVPIALSSLSNTCVGAGKDVMVGLSLLNACDNAPAHLIQIDYLTSG